MKALQDKNRILWLLLLTVLLAIAIYLIGFHSERPLYFRVVFGKEGKNSMLGVVYDSGGTGAGYDVAYIDENMNGDLTDDIARKFPRLVSNSKGHLRKREVPRTVYQADGSRNFTSGNLQTGTIDWSLFEGSVDFSEGQVERYGPDEDLQLRQEQGVLKFRVFHVRGPNGFYDAGAVPLDSVTEAAETGYTRGNKPCKVGHVYVVRTCEEDNYAKFIVKSLEAF